MLEFYYNFLDKFVARPNHQLCEMDTDSMYFVLSKPTLDVFVKPDKLKEFYHFYGKLFPHEV